MRELVDEGGERADFAFDEVRGLFDKAGQFGIQRLGGFGFGAALEMADEALGRKLNRRERVLDFVRDAASNLLPSGGFLRKKEFGEVVDDEDIAGVGAARAEGADGDGGVKNAASDNHFDFTRGDAHAKGAAHKVLHNARGFGAEKRVERFGLWCGGAEDACHRGVGAHDARVRGRRSSSCTAC